MKKLNWQIKFGLFLFILSAALYLLHFLIFRDPHHIFIYMLGDLAFVPIEVLLVVVVIHGWLRHREKKAKLEKLHMITGVFFSEIGTELLHQFVNADPASNKLASFLQIKENWSKREFLESKKKLLIHTYRIEISEIDLEILKVLLTQKKSFLTQLYVSPMLMEQESFTELLRSILHLADELERREDMSNLPESDYRHLANDAERVYRHLVIHWLDYMIYLKEHYPYLFSLAVRTNPFDPNASAVVSS